MNKTTPALLLCFASLAACRTTELGRLPRTASESVRHHATACDQNDPVGCYALAIVYSIGADTRQGVEKDGERAADLFEFACQGGIPEACDARQALP